MNNGHTVQGTRQSAGLKPGQRGGTGIEDMVPVVAFKERRAIRTLTGLDEIQSHQRAGRRVPPQSTTEPGFSGALMGHGTSNPKGGCSELDET